MINDYNLIEKVVMELSVEDKKVLIVSSLKNKINEDSLKEDYNRKQELSDERFRKAQEKYETETAIYDNSNYENAKSSLEKSIKAISTKLESLGF